MNREGDTRFNFDLEKLKDPETIEAFQARMGGKFTKLTLLDAEDTDMDTLIMHIQHSDD